MTSDTTSDSRWTEYQPVAALVPAARNAKAHDQGALAASLAEFGFVEPVVVDERTGQLLAGHGRAGLLSDYQAAGSPPDDWPTGAPWPPTGVQVDDAGAWLVPVVRGVASRDDDHAEAMGIALNRVGERGGWAEEILAEALASMPDTLVIATGWTVEEMDDLMAGLQEVAFVPGGPGDGEFGKGAHEGNSYKEWETGYRNKQVRSMVFDYPLDDYALVAGMAARARKAHGVESNAELFQAMLTAWSEANPE